MAVIRHDTMPRLLLSLFREQVYKLNFDLQPCSLTDQVAGEHQP